MSEEQEKRRQLLAMEASLRDISAIIGSALPPGVCFALLTFTEGENGFTSYASNAKREDVIEALKETIVRLETNTVAPAGMPDHPANKRGKG